MAREKTLALSAMLASSATARRLSNDAVDIFKHDGSNRAMTALFERFAADYDDVTGFIWVYSGERGIGITLPNEIKAMAEESRELDYDRFLFLMKFVPVPMCLSLADMINACMGQYSYTFNSAIKLAAAVLSDPEPELIDAVFYEGGLLQTVATDMLLTRTHAMAFDNSSNRVFKTIQSPPRPLQEIPLVQYDYMNPNFSYKPESFVLKCMQNTNDQMPVGATATIGNETGVWIKPDSAESDRMVSDIVNAWLIKLRKDNGLC